MAVAPTLTVVIPAYDEERTIAELVARVLAEPTRKEVLVVDDGSSDRTADVVEAIDDPRVRCLRSERNRGRGHALRRGWGEARGQVVLHQDADLEYDPGEYADLVRPILGGEADVVYGTRFARGQPPMLWRSRVGNRVLRGVFNALYAPYLRTGPLGDLMTCYKVLDARVLPRLACRSDRFEFEAELTARIHRQGLRVIEVPIRYEARGYTEGKKIGAADFLAVLTALVRYRFAPLDGA